MGYPAAAAVPALAVRLLNRQPRTNWRSLTETGANCPLSRVVEGARLLDMAPTLLDLAGYEVPASMQGRSLVAGMDKKRDSSGQEQIILDRLAGLGYV